jgi:hypothetical protein
VHDRFLEHGSELRPEDLALLGSVLEQLGTAPLGVRSSATNEAGMSLGRDRAVHAGENISFMLPNNHPDPLVRLGQLRDAVRHIYRHFALRAERRSAGGEKMAIVLNPIPGLFDDTLAGPFYYPYISGVANSFFPHALKSQDPHEGFARIAFGHGYATVLDDFPVISMATIRNPIPVDLLQKGGGQQYFYALDMTKNQELRGEELETMSRLHVKLANFHKIKLLGVERNVLTIEQLVQHNHFGFRTGLERLMEAIGAAVSSHFQIELVFNIDFKKKPYEDGIFHVVQLTLLPELSHQTVHIPDEIGRAYLAINNQQGHGVKTGIAHAVVVSPFLYTRSRHDEVRRRLAAINQQMRDRAERYLVIVPGRLGSKNRDWGIEVDYDEIDQAAGIFEYGVDIAGRSEPLPEQGNEAGGVYGSHFLYMMHGGYSEEQKRIQTRMFGTQGTHFLTNLMANDVVYGFIAPTEDRLDPWFFSPPDSSDPLYVLTFPAPVSIYADSVSRRCVVIAERTEAP